MSFNVFTPERQRKVAQYLRMMEKRAPVWNADEVTPPHHDEPAREKEGRQEKENIEP
jgi:hypothetical protein